jgi:hypothetical protein
MTEMINPTKVRRSLALSKQAGWPARGSKELADIDAQLEKEFPTRKNIMANQNYSNAIGPTKPFEFDSLFPKTSLDMPETNMFGVNLGGQGFYSPENLHKMKNMIPNVDDEDSFADKSRQEGFDPFQDFKFGLNMPTFQLGKGALDVGSNLLNVFNNFRNYGLRKDQFEFQKELGNKQYADQRRIMDNKRANANFGIMERNDWKKQYGGPDGKYLQQDLLK